jgi:kinesin family protein 4/21/27
VGEEELKVRVAVRVRLLLGHEKGQAECLDSYENSDNTSTVVIGETKTFVFDYVFDQKVSQETMFNNIGVPLIDQMFAGYNASMLAYGQTGSGKTFTMGTGNMIGILNEHIGLVPRVAQRMFEYVTAAQSKREFKLTCSFIELYNEEVKDLFDPVAKTITIREDKTEGIVLVGTCEKEINSYEEMLSLLELGSLSRPCTAPT